MAASASSNRTGTSASAYSIGKSASSVTGRSSTSVAGRAGKRDALESSYDPGSDYFARIAVIGDGGVGKSTLVEREVAGQLQMTPVVGGRLTSVGINFMTKRYRNMDCWFTMQYWDAPGDHTYAKETGRYCAGSAGYVLVFDVNRPETLKNLEDVWIPQLRKNVVRGGGGASGENETSRVDLRNSPSLRPEKEDNDDGWSRAGREEEEENDEHGTSGGETWPPMVIIGNKADVTGDITETAMAGLGKTNRVYTEQATLFAERFHAEYFEASAVDGSGVADAFTHITMEVAKLIPDPVDFSALLSRGITPVRPLTSTEGVMFRHAEQKRLAARPDVTGTVDWL